MKCLAETLTFLNVNISAGGGMVVKRDTVIALLLPLQLKMLSFYCPRWQALKASCSVTMAATVCQAGELGFECCEQLLRWGISPAERGCSVVDTTSIALYAATHTRLSAESVPPPACDRDCNMLQLLISTEGQPGTTQEQDSFKAVVEPKRFLKKLNDKAPCSLVRSKAREFTSKKDENTVTCAGTAHLIRIETFSHPVKNLQYLQSHCFMWVQFGGFSLPISDFHDKLKQVILGNPLI